MPSPLTPAAVILLLLLQASVVAPNSPAPSRLGPHPPGGPAAEQQCGPPASLAWLSEWRLRAALTSPRLFRDLSLQLALLAARCYCR